MDSHRANGAGFSRSIVSADVQRSPTDSIPWGLAEPRGLLDDGTGGLVPMTEFSDRVDPSLLL